MTSDLTELLARVEAAEGPDRELDEALGQMVDRHEYEIDGTAHYYTACLDAALALCERVLPGWGWELSFVPGNDPPYDVTLWPPQGGHRIWVSGRTAPLTLLSTLLRAKLAQTEPTS